MKSKCSASHKILKSPGQKKNSWNQIYQFHEKISCSTDTSSQFSVDIVEVAPRGLEMENKNEVQIENGPQTDGDGIVLNASKLQVETEKWILNT